MLKKATFVILISFLMSSCVSLDDPSENKEGLLLIPYAGKFNKDSGGGFGFFGQYRYTFKSIENDQYIAYTIPINNGTGMLYLSPGRYVIKKTDFVYRVTRNKPSTAYNPYLVFEIEEGCITILPIKITTIATGDPDNYYRTQIHAEYSNISEQERAEIIASISELKNFDLWTITTK